MKAEDSCGLERPLSFWLIVVGLSGHSSDPPGPAVISRTIRGSTSRETLTKTARRLQFNESKRETLDFQLTRELQSGPGNELTFIIREGSKAKFKKAISEMMVAMLVVASQLHVGNGKIRIFFICSQDFMRLLRKQLFNETFYEISIPLNLCKCKFFFRLMIICVDLLLLDVLRRVKVFLSKWMAIVIV